MLIWKTNSLSNSLLVWNIWVTLEVILNWNTDLLPVWLCCHYSIPSNLRRNCLVASMIILNSASKHKCVPPCSSRHPSLAITPSPWYKHSGLVLNTAQCDSVISALVWAELSWAEQHSLPVHCHTTHCLPSTATTAYIYGDTIYIPSLMLYFLPYYHQDTKTLTFIPLLRLLG